MYRREGTWKTSFCVLICMIGVIAQAGLVWSRAPLHRVEDNNKRISGQYIVVLQPNATPNKVLRRLDSKSQRNVRSTYKNVINGFAGKFDEKDIDELLDSEDVKYVVEDAIVTVAETPPSWGLDRVDERNLTLGNTATSFLGDGTGVHIYIADTGIRYTHEEFTGRTGLGYNAVPDEYSYDQDCQGHGTHCAGTAAGSRFGVAKNATVHSLRVFGCTGSEPISDIVKALDWVAINAERPAVVSMSLGGSPHQALEDAVANLINVYDIVVSAAAGNSGWHACFESPTRVQSALAVGSTDIDDNVSYFSNFGSCVDMFAPGRNIPSASHTSDTGSAIRSGTSMACPHVSGALAILLGLDNTLNATEEGNVLLRGATTGKIDHIYAPDRLLYIGQETCMLRCGSPEDGGKPCQCDDGCEGRGDCCTDYSFVCAEKEPTCRGRCDSTPDAAYPCQCDADCESRNDCCPDHVVLCTGPTCNNRCGEYNETLSCQCNDECVSYNDCCPDKLVICDEVEELCVNTNFTYEWRVTSHNSEYAYPNNFTCSNNIQAPGGHIYLVISGARNFHVLEGDGLTIYDGSDKNAPVLVDNLSGSEDEFWLIQSTGRHMHLVFQTDESGTAGGFLIPFFFQSACDATVTVPGIITSSNYPFFYYYNQRCLSNIEAGEGQQVMFTMLDMSIESAGDSGCYDILQVYDTNGARLSAVCGESPPRPLPPHIRSTGERLSLLFQSDGYLNWRGYAARVSFVGVPQAFSTKVETVKAWLGGFMGKIRVRITEVAENWRLEATFQKDVFNLQISDCGAKLADLPGNGRHKRVFILDAEKDDKKILYPGDKLEIQFVAKVWKRLRVRGTKFDAVLYTNY